jgi:cytochrome b involved in lipid metabolism
MFVKFLLFGGFWIV